MLMNVKLWLESTGMKVAEERFLNPPPFPYVVFSEELDTSGADNKNCIANRNITVELYSESINREAEGKIEALLNEKIFKFKKDRTWIESQRFYQTVYDFQFTEKF